MSSDPREIVVLLHGIGHTKWDMFHVDRALRKGGYATLNITYPSLKKDLRALASFLEKRLSAATIWNDYAKVHFVTHSMGGLLARYYLEYYRAAIPAEKLGKIVMLAPPNGGSEVADLLRDFIPYRWIFGPAGQELTTHAQKANAFDMYYDVGIIAGSVGWPYLLGCMTLPGLHDGRVSVASTRLDGMKDHITLQSTHSFISWKAQTHRHILTFLAGGRF